MPGGADSLSRRDVAEKLPASATPANEQGVQVGHKPPHVSVHHAAAKAPPDGRTVASMSRTIGITLVP